MVALDVDAVLLDLEGVLGVGGREAIPGAPQVLRRLRAGGVPFRVVTNTTTVSRAGLAEEVRTMGLEVRTEELHTAPVATAAYIRANHPGDPVFLLVKGNTAEDFEGIELVQESARVVAVGGAEEEFTYDAMNRAYRMLVEGARLVAMSRSVSWMTPEGLKLDAGPYVRALEEAAEVEAVGGGDDISTDVMAGQAAGLTGVLVRTGKFRPADLERPDSPDHVIDSVAGLPELLGLA